MTDRIIPIVMICDDNFVMQTCVALTSLYLNKSGNTKYDVFIVLAECSETSAKTFLEMNREDFSINLVRASLERYRDIKQLSHISIACLLKFDICELIPQYDKLLYLDGDIIVRCDLMDLYDTHLDNNYAGAVKELYCVKKDDGCINAGIMLFNAKKMRDDGMRNILVEKRRSLGNRSSMDQQTYNMIIKEHIKYLSIIYNCVPGRLIGDMKMDYTIDEVNKLYGTNFKNARQLTRKATIIHFATGNKPWKYTFAPYAKEWYKYYLKSPYGTVSFKRYGRWGYRFHNIKEKWSKNGLKNTIRYIINRLLKKGNKKREKVDWD